MKRISHFKGNTSDVGLAIGRALGKRLDRNISKYFTGINQWYGVRFGRPVNFERLKGKALPWMRNLPLHYQHELEGIAEGAKIPLERVAEWCSGDMFAYDDCSGFVCLVGGNVWIARNCDFILPELHGYTIIRDVDKRIPTMIFGKEGEVFSSTGVNKEKLWLHYNWLPVWDAPTGRKQCLTPQVFLREGLETCRTVEDVDRLLNNVERDMGMNLFAVDGKGNEFSVFECTCCTHVKRESRNGRISGTNHYCFLKTPREFQNGTESSWSRLQRMEELLNNKTLDSLPDDLIQILADQKVEQNSDKVVTIYSNIACPKEGLIWHMYGGSPAASSGICHRIDWPWSEQTCQQGIES